MMTIVLIFQSYTRADPEHDHLDARQQQPLQAGQHTHIPVYREGTDNTGI